MSFDVAVVQWKPRKGDLSGNIANLGGVFEQLLASAAGAPHLVVLPEAAMTGYFLEGAVYDLALSADAFASQLNAVWRNALRRVDHVDGSIDVACGFYENADGTYHNSALYVRLSEHGPHIVHVHRKLFLPTYGVFDEERFLTRGRRLQTFETPFGRAAILICEDAWHSLTPTIAALKGARLIIVPSASPGRGIGGSAGELESVQRWRAILGAIGAEHGVYVLYAGLTGFEGGKGMSGASTIVSPRGDVLHSLNETEVAILRASLDPAEVDLARAVLPLLGDLAAVLPDLWYDVDLPLPRWEVPDAAGR